MAKQWTPRAEAREQAQEKLGEALAMLATGIGGILDGDNFARYLRTMGRFHHYSASNIFLILAQRPEATRVAGYRAWQALGRQVRKGEKGLVILVPYTSRASSADADADAGEGEASSPARVVTRFGVGHVFDLGQTDGEPLPEPPAVEYIATATDRGQALYGLLHDWLISQGVTVAVEDCGRPNGYYAPLQRRIVVHSRLMGTDHATKTLAHEAAHYVAEHRAGLDRSDAETVAECVAYAILYVARWAEDNAVLKRNLDSIRQTAETIITGLDNQAGDYIGGTELLAG